MIYQTIEATHAHIAELAENMRADDVREIAAMSGLTPLGALNQSRVMTRVVTAGLNEEGRVVCMFGIAQLSLVSPKGIPWLLSSSLIEGYGLPLIREGRKWLAGAMEEFSFLINYVDARNLTAIKLVRGLGFTVGETFPVGRDGELFHVFEMRA